MIGQYLSNKNENATVPKTKKVFETKQILTFDSCPPWLLLALVLACDGQALDAWSW